MLVVGPNPAFMEYVSHVLPTLGEESVEQRAVGELVDGVEVTRADPLEVQQLKASLRLARRRPARGRARLGGRAGGARRPARRAASSASRRDEVAELLDEARGGARPHGGRARAVPDERRCAASTRTTARGSAVRRSARFDEIERALRRDGRTDPVPRPRLAGAEAGAGRAAAARVAASGSRRPRTGSSTPDEQRAPSPRRGSGWSEADLPLHRRGARAPRRAAARASGT